jgi:hypothetical protein
MFQFLVVPVVAVVSPHWSIMIDFARRLLLSQHPFDLIIFFGVVGLSHVGGGAGLNWLFLLLGS